MWCYDRVRMPHGPAAAQALHFSTHGSMGLYPDGLTAVKKFIIANNRLYTVGTNRFNDNALSQQDRNEAQNIINSFRFLGK